MTEPSIQTLAGRIAVVGNAPQAKPSSHLVDDADHVVRFNNPFGYGGSTGTALHELFLINCGGQMREWLDDGALTSAPHIRAAHRISFPIHPDVANLYPAEVDPQALPDPDGVNHAAEAADVLARAGHTVRTLPLKTYLAACDAIGIGTFAAGSAAPSSGYLALFDILDRAEPAAQIDVFGFGFAGWAGHDWEAERAWSEAMHRRGRIVLHAP